MKLVLTALITIILLSGCESFSLSDDSRDIIRTTTTQLLVSGYLKRQDNPVNIASTLYRYASGVLDSRSEDDTLTIPVKDLVYNFDMSDTTPEEKIIISNFLQAAQIQLKPEGDRVSVKDFAEAVQVAAALYMQGAGASHEE